MWRLKFLFALMIPVGLVACDFDPDFSPTVGNRPLSREEREGPRETGALPTDGSTTPTVSFANDIRPLIKRSATSPDPLDAKGCYPCHDGRAPVHVGVDLGGLDLSTLGKLREGGGTSRSQIVIPGDPENSAIIQKLRGTYPYGTRMPKNGPPFWSEAEIALVEQWIAEGAVGEDNE
jgi:hypothetical protein